MADVKRNLLFENGLSRAAQCPIRTLQLRPVGLYGCQADASGVLATLDDGSTGTYPPLSGLISTHKTEVREVHYPWHPLYRQEVPVRLERRWKIGCVARGDRDSDVGRRGFDTPAWMLDRALCSTMKLSPTPIVDIEALTELRRLLDWVLGKEEPRMVEGGYRLDAGQGGTYAQVTTPTRITGVVSPAREDS